MSEKPQVNSYDEWTQLREVIVGCVDGFAGFQLDNSFNLFCWSNLKSYLESRKFFENRHGEIEWPVIKIEPKIVEELEQDVEEFVEALQAAEVVVRRPATVVGSEKTRTPYWTSIQSPPLNVRDQTIVLGDCIVETAPHVKMRVFENDYLKPLFYEYFQNGAGWIAMPQPTLSSKALDSSFFKLSRREKFALQDEKSASITGLGLEIIFDGAQCIRLGRDVLVNVGNKNHEMALEWLKRTFGHTFTFHRLEKMADSHIDSMILPLRPGLWLLRDPSILEFLPPALRKWDFIVPPERRKYPFTPKYRNKILQSSGFLDMNILSINEETVVVNSLFPEMISKLEKHGFNVMGVRHRHGRLFGGGFHCFTLDVRRDGALETYW